MPYKKKMTARRKKYVPRTRRKYYKRRAPGLTKKVVQSGKNPIPDQMFVKMPYSGNVLMTSGVTPQVHQFRNSLNDPDFTGTGHQPWSRDQWVAFYNLNTVFGIGYRFTLINTLAVPVLYTIAPQNHSGGSVSISLAREKPYSITGVLGPVGSGLDIRSHKGYMSVAKALQIDKKRLSQEKAFWTPFGTNPGTDETAYLTIQSQAADLLSTATIRVMCDLVYYVKMFDRSTIGSS